jgi:hypothetical protein
MEFSYEKIKLVIYGKNQGCKSSLTPSFVSSHSLGPNRKSTLIARFEWILTKAKKIKAIRKKLKYNIGYIKFIYRGASE